MQSLQEFTQRFGKDSNHELVSSIGNQWLCIAGRANPAEVTAANLANAETTSTESGKPYQKMNVVFGARPVRFQSFNGMMLASLADLHAEDVRVVRLAVDDTPPMRRYEPGHPDADKEGYVAYPSINPAEEMVNLMGAARAYEMNASAITSTKNMIQTALTILT